MDVPDTHYARRGDLQIAYQVAGEGPLDVVAVSAYLSNIELYWEVPAFSRLLGRLSSFSRLILFDRRGSGMSDGVPGADPLEETVEDVQAVIDAAVQLHGGDGVRTGFAVEGLYREIRALRIYEGASDVQRIVIARALG